MKYPHFYENYCLTRKKCSDSIIYYNKSINHIIHDILKKIYRIGISYYNKDYKMVKIYITHIYEALITINETDDIKKFVLFFENNRKLGLHDYHIINDFCLQNNIIDAIYDKI